MANDILDLMDPGNDSAFDPDMAPAPEPSYLNKRAPFDMDGTIQRVFFHDSRKIKGKTYLICEFAYETGEYTHSDGDKNPKPGEPAEEGDLISLMFDLDPSRNDSKFVLREMATVLDACIGGRKGVCSKVNGEFGLTESTKAKLVKKVGEDLADRISVTDDGAFRVSGLARLVNSGLLDGSKINLHTTNEKNGWYKFGATSIAPANDLDAVTAALG